MSNLDIASATREVIEAARRRGLDIDGKFTVEQEGHCLVYKIRLKDGRPVEDLPDARRHTEETGEVIEADSILIIRVCPSHTTFQVSVSVLDIWSGEYRDIEVSGVDEDDWEREVGEDIGRLNDPEVRKRLGKKTPETVGEGVEQALDRIDERKLRPDPEPPAAPPAPPVAPPPPSEPEPEDVQSSPRAPKPGVLVGGGLLGVLILLWVLLFGPGKTDEPPIAASSPEATAMAQGGVVGLDEPESQAVPNAPPRLGAIRASFTYPVTTYRVHAEDPNGDPLEFTWAWTGACGTWSPADRFAQWAHPHEGPQGCPEDSTEHPGTITVSVTDGIAVCTAVYEGSLPGRGPIPDRCEAVA